MEGGDAVEGGEPGVGKVMDQFFFMLHVIVVLLLTWLVSNLGKSYILVVLLICYLFWIQQQFWEREKRRIRCEERKKISSRKAMTEGETLRWMNEGLKMMWPISMEKFASQHFFKPMAPWFLKRFKPKYVKEVTLQYLDLGSTPPDFSLIRALPSPQDGDDVIFEANMEFSSGKDMNAQMTVQMKGIKTTFYISKLYIKGTVKFSVKFLKGWPVLGRVRFSFANTPIVDMTARPNFKNGLDMRFIPGAANWLEETLGTALEQSVVEPYMLVIDFEKLVSNMMFPDTRPRHGLQEFFSVEPKSGFSQTVLVEILEAGELKAPSNGLPDPIVEVTLGTHKERTKSKTKTLNPIWANEVQRIPIVNWALPNLLTLRVISKRSLGPRELGICSIPVKDYQNGERHVMRLKLENVPTGWIRVAITVESSRESSHGTEEPHASIGSQPTTRDIQSISPPQSAAATTINASVNHTRSSSTEEAGVFVPALHEAQEEGGSTEIIKMPYGTQGAFTIQCPGEGECLKFPDPPIMSARKPRNGNEKGSTFESKDRDAKVKRSMMSILGFKKRSMSKVAHEISPPEREMTLSEHSGYSSSLDRSTELKVYHGALKMNLLSPEMPSREPPSVDIHPLMLETVLSENPESMKTPDMGHQHTGCNSNNNHNNNNNNINLGSTTEPQELVSFSSELNTFSSRRGPEPEKQNSKNNSWWKSLTKRPKRRKARGGKPDVSHNNVESHDQLEYESYDPSDTSASQSFRKEPQDVIKTLLLHHEYNVTTDNGSSILTCGRSQSCRQDAIKRVVYNAGLSQSLRFDTSSSLLNTIHEKQGLDRPHH